MNASDIEWADPPPPQRPPRGSVAVFVQILRSNPGRWAKLGTRASGGNTTSYKRAYPGTEWTSRVREDGRVDVYGRWVGGPEPVNPVVVGVDL